MKGKAAREMFDCIPEIDYDSGSRYFLGNAQNYAQALLSILKSVKSKLPILQAMISSREYEGLRSITQTLQKMFGNIGAHGLVEASYQLEKLLLNNEISLIPVLLTEYVDGLAAFSEHMELLFKSRDFKNNVVLEENSPTFLNYDFAKTKESIKLSSDLLERKII